MHTWMHTSLSVFSAIHVYTQGRPKTSQLFLFTCLHKFTNRHLSQFRADWTAARKNSDGLQLVIQFWRIKDDIYSPKLKCSLTLSALARSLQHSVVLSLALPLSLPLSLCLFLFPSLFLFFLSLSLSRLLGQFPGIICFWTLQEEQGTGGWRRYVPKCGCRPRAATTQKPTVRNTLCNCL